MEETLTGPDVLDLSLKLKEALDDFRRAVEEAVEQRKSLNLQRRSAINASGKPAIRKFPVRIREPAWITSREAISLLGVSLRTLRRYRKQQLFTYKTVNGAYRYLYIDLVELIKSRSTNI